MPYRFILLLILISNFVFANNEKIILHSAPVGMEALSVNPKEHKNLQKYKGRHGLREYCYSNNNGFITYIYNILGQGYILSKTNEKNRICNNTKIIAKNAIGISLNMKRKKIEGLLGIKIKSNQQDVIWQSSAKINGTQLDIQTYATFKFSRERLVYLSVFTIETY